MNKPYITKVHIMMEVLAAVIGLAALIVALVFALTEEGPVPTHYDLSGNPDAWGSAWGGIILPVIMLLTNVMMSAVIHFTKADSWNLGVSNIRPSRRNLIISDACTMMALMEILFAGFSLAFTLLNAFGSGKGMMIVTAVLLVLMTASVVWFFITAKRHNKQ